MDYEQLHRDALLIDSHNDTIVAHIRAGDVSLAGAPAGAAMSLPGTIAFLGGREYQPPPVDPCQVSFAKMRQGGMDAGFFSIDVTTARHNHLAYAMDGFGYLWNDVERSGADVVFVRSAEDIVRAKVTEKPAILLAIENADCTEKSLGVVRSLYELGVRSIGMTHHVSSVAADGCLEARDGVGLTQFGVALVGEMNRLGMLVDLAHISPGGFFHALEVSEKPVIFSHGNTRALCDHPRNLTDEQLRALAENGGVMGVTFVPDFVDADNPSLECLLDHIDHIAEVAGIETAAIGSDFDGGGTLLEDAIGLPCITEGLLRRGYSAEAVRKVLGENTLRVLRSTIG